MNRQRTPGAVAQDRAKLGSSPKPIANFKSTTDPHATLVRQGGLKSRRRSKSHRVVDDDHEIITAVETTTGAVDEGTPAGAHRGS